MSVLSPQPDATPRSATDLTTDALAERLLGAVLGAVDLISVGLGDKLGWYRSLAEQGPATPGQLAERTGTDARYAREWLEQQAVTGLLTVDGPTEDGGERTYTMPPATQEVLTDEHSLAYLGPFGSLVATLGGQLPALVHAYRTGGGVPWAALGAEGREGQAALNRPWFEQALPDALRSVEDLHERLSRPGARIADVGAGGAWSSIALARAYPQARIDALDIDLPTVQMAQANVAAAGVEDRVTLTHGEASSLEEGSYDVVFAFECVHDVPRPVELLAAVRRALVPGGVLIVMDEAVAETFTAPGTELERLMYGFSLTVCLPDGLSHPPSAATGTVMRPSTLEGYAHRAGFRECEVLPIRDFGFWRFYRLQG